VGLNYFNYFTEIEARFQQRRGSILMLSTLDWALVETWREAGVPLEAVLRGMDAAFDKYEAQRARLGARRQRKVNGLAWCAQAVMEAAEQAREAAIGAASGASAQVARDSGFEAGRIARYLGRNAVELDAAAGRLEPPAGAVAAEAAARHRELAAKLDAESLEDVDRVLTVLEEKLFAALTAATPEPELTALRMQADRELAPYRGRMQAVQIKQVQQQFLQKRLLEMHRLPRLSLFYMPHEDD
jgi:ParB-like chromosome segregation protein Spo0J